MKYQDIKDKWRIYKSVMKSKLTSIPLLTKYSVARKAIKLLDIKNVDKVIKGWPDTVIIITDDKIVRIPLDELSLTRCRMNKKMLERLSESSICSYVPRFLNEGISEEYTYFCETKLPGYAVGTIPLNRINELILKAAEFITEFQKKTFKDIIVDNNSFKGLIGNDIKILTQYLDDSNKSKINQIEEKLRQQLVGKKIKTTWFHGDYKLDNVLFNIKNWKIEGVIDWDLSKQEGLPLLDIFFLLIYKDSMITGKNISDIFKNRFLKLQFNSAEERIIQEYLNSMKLTDVVIKPLLIVFWLNHIMHRYWQYLVTDMPYKEEWLSENIYEVIDVIGLME